MLQNDLKTVHSEIRLELAKPQMDANGTSLTSLHVVFVDCQDAASRWCMISRNLLLGDREYRQKRNKKRNVPDQIPYNFWVPSYIQICPI